MVKVKYYGSLSDPVVTEWHPINNPKVGTRALATLARIANKSGLEQDAAPTDSMAALAEFMNGGNRPAGIEYHKRGKFFEIVDRVWSAQEA